MNEETPDRALQATERSDSSRRRARYRRLFEDCWAPVRTVVEEQLLTALIETLGPLAKSLDEADSKRVKAVLARDRAFVQAYLDALHPELIASIGSFVEAGGSEGGGARALSLIGHEDSEFDAAIDQCAARLRNSVDTEFAAVKLRLINLLHDVDLRDSDLPFRIALFVRAIAGALRHIAIAEPDVVPLMRLVSSGLSRVVGQAYKQIEKRLADSGASDAVPVWHSTVVGTHGAARGRSATGTSGAERMGNEIVSLGDAQSSSMLLSLLERLQPGAFATAGTAAAAGTAGTGPMAGAASATPGGAALTRADRVAFLESRAPGSGWSFDPALISAINDALRMTADTASRKIDKLTIELVGLLFDRIQRDRHIPDAIKEQLARLQFPLLKVALGDPELFADPRQPARRLLDRIASTSIGWSAEGEDNQRYFEQVRDTVDWVVHAGGDPSKAFEQSLGQLERFL